MFRKVVSGFLIGTLGVSLSGCLSNEKLLAEIQEAKEGQRHESPSTGCRSNRKVNRTTEALRLIKPAISVRGGSCLMCHAQIRSSIITDFGKGDSYFLGGPQNSSMGNYYFNHALSSWQTARIQGSVIVPKVDVERAEYSRLLNLFDPSEVRDSIPLCELLQLPFLRSDYGSPPQPETVAGVTPASGADRVIEKDQIYIGAPTEAEIQGIVPSLFAEESTLYWKHISPDAQKPALSGLEVAGAGDRVFVRNVSGQTFTCFGDVVVRGVLFLNRVRLKTDSSGCRLYVTGSVFVQGSFEYDGSFAGANLQITSARAILMGFNAQTLSHRLLLSGDRSWVMPFSYTRGSGSNAEKNQKILNEALLVSDLVDADQTDASEVAQMNHSHLIFNAPQIHSRYIRSFQGVLVGEIILFRLGQFVFEFDPLFETTPALPLLPRDVLIVKDNDEPGSEENEEEDDHCEDSPPPDVIGV